MSWRSAIAAAIALVIAAWSPPAAAAPALWVARDGDSEVWLFGTMHALTPEARWRTPAYDRAYARAGTVWFEADLDGADPQTLKSLMARYGVDPDRTLSQKLGPRELAALKPVLAQGHTSLTAVDHMRPWVAALMLSMQPVLAKGARVESGADITVTRDAKAEAKHVKVFETLEEQVAMFAGLSEPAEVAYLADVLGGPERSRLALRRPEPSLEKAWLSGDLARLGPGLTGAIARDNPEFYDALIRRRNHNWADMLTREMRQGSGVELVNVGALHMAQVAGVAR
jgi:uncharacterized protein YbaP (TraB family)